MSSKGKTRYVRSWAFTFVNASKDGNSWKTTGMGWRPARGNLTVSVRGKGDLLMIVECLGGRKQDNKLVFFVAQA
jgi:hypothetical protein